MSMYYCELVEKIEEYNRKKYLGVIKTKKIIGIEEVNNTKTLPDVDDQLTNNIGLKEVVMFLTWIIKDDYKYYPQIFLEEASNQE